MRWRRENQGKGKSIQHDGTIDAPMGEISLKYFVAMNRALRRRSEQRKSNDGRRMLATGMKNDKPQEIRHRTDEMAMEHTLGTKMPMSTVRERIWYLLHSHAESAPHVELLR